MNLAEILVHQAKTRPDAPALVHKERELTYSYLDVISNRFANSLKSLHTGYGTRVALIIPNIPEYIISFFSVLKTGATAVPVNFLFKGDELKYVLKHSVSSVAIVYGPLLPSLLAIRKDLPDLKKIIVFAGENIEEDIISYEALIKEASKELLLYKTQKDDVAVILYTSGTTGRLKGAMLTHNNIYFDLKAANEVADRTSSDCFLVVIPLFHSFAMTCCMALGAYCGAKLVLMERFVPKNTLEAINKHKVTIFLGVPSIYGALLLHSRRLPKDEEFESLEICISGGAPMPEKLHRDFEARFKTVIIEGDGPTECSPVTSLNPITGERKIGSIGFPLPGVEMKIFDEDGNEVSDEVIGEIVVRGDNVMKGYLDDPEATEEAMRGGWFHTGDLGKRDKDGYFYIVDRKKDLIITGGLNVYPREIEELLFNHPAILEVSVTSKPDSLRGEVPQVFAVLREGSSVTEKELISYCRKHLARFKVPREVTFLEFLPKSYTGKVLKRMLREKTVLGKCDYEGG